MTGAKHPVQERTHRWNGIFKIAIAVMAIAEKMAYAM
jgi:hypothetical protein